MTFRTNQPGSALASLLCILGAQQNRAMDLRRIPLSSTTLSISALAFEFLQNLPLSIERLDADRSGGPRFCLYQAATEPTSTATVWSSIT